MANYLYGAAFGPGGSGHFPNETVSDWLENADISTLENLMEVFGIGYGYTYTPPATTSSSSGQSWGNNGITHYSVGVCQYWQSCYEPVVTREEMRPDALIFGSSGSAAGVLYGVVGGELIYNFQTGQLSSFAFHGQGAGVALEGDQSVYGGLVWNLNQNIEYEGISPTLSVDLGLGIHGQVSVFWEEGTIPFTGDTWGISIGPGAGAGVAVIGSFGHYSCVTGCR